MNLSNLIFALNNNTNSLLTQLMCDIRSKVVMTTINITDLALSAYLTLKQKLIKIEDEYGTKVSFVFEDTPELQQDITSFYNNNSQVDPLTYFNSLKNLKSLIYTRRNNYVA